MITHFLKLHTYTILQLLAKKSLPLTELYEEKKKSKRTSGRNTEGHADLFHPSGKVTAARHVPYLFISGNGGNGQ